MYIERKPVSVAYKLFLSLVSAIGLWAAYAQFGAAAWRLFVVWVLILSTAFFLISALVLAVSRKRLPNENPCPMCEGMILIGFLLSGVTTIINYITTGYSGVTGWAAGLVYASLPIFVFSDWLFFSKKGRWQLIDPFYWLALPMSYVGIILFTAEIMPHDTALRYPISFLNYQENGFFEMLGWFAVFAILILTFSYLFVVIDMLISGRVGEHIVLPRIKTVIVEEKTEAITTEEKIVQEEPIKAEPIVRKEKSSEPSAKAKAQPKYPRKSSNQSQKTGTKPKPKQNTNRPARTSDNVKPRKPRPKTQKSQNTKTK